MTDVIVLNSAELEITAVKFTSPNQGALFAYFSLYVLNIVPISRVLHGYYTDIIRILYG